MGSSKHWYLTWLFYLITADRESFGILLKLAFSSFVSDVIDFWRVSELNLVNAWIRSNILQYLPQQAFHGLLGLLSTLCFEQRILQKMARGKWLWWFRGWNWRTKNMYIPTKSHLIHHQNKKLMFASGLKKGQDSARVSLYVFTQEE